jgi:hypothetical protein
VDTPSLGPYVQAAINHFEVISSRWCMCPLHDHKKGTEHQSQTGHVKMPGCCSMGKMYWKAPRRSLCFPTDTFPCGVRRYELQIKGRIVLGSHSLLLLLFPPHFSEYSHLIHCPTHSLCSTSCASFASPKPRPQPHRQQYGRTTTSRREAVCASALPPTS